MARLLSTNDSNRKVVTIRIEGDNHLPTVNMEGDPDTGTERRAGSFIGPEFGTVSRPDLVAAAREAADADFDVLITCVFSYEAARATCS